MKRRYLFGLCGSTFFASLLPLNALAARKVIDLANLSQNLITAIESTTNTIIGGKQLVEDMKQTLNTFPLIDQLSKSQELTQLIEVIRAAQKLNGALRDAKSTYEHIGSAFSSSRYTSFESFLSEIDRRRKVGDDTAKHLYDSAKLAEDQVAKAFEAHQSITAGMPMISGVTQAVQATANSVGVLIQQQQAVLAMMSASARDTGKERQREYDERAKQEQGWKKSAEDRAKDFDNDMKILKSLGK
jgi:conjugal transfer/entry exclusion protein